MKILALDPATILGFAYGESGDIPKSGSVRLKGRRDEITVAPFNALAFLRDLFVLDKPDLCCIEHYMNPVAQKSADAIVLQIMVFGAIIAVCGSYGVRIETPHRQTVLKHFIGKANMGERALTKQAVIKRAIALHYIPHGCVDDNRADACALFDYAAATFARARPREIVLFGEST
jgi:hypothetical protein